MTLGTCYDVFMRYLFRAPTNWAFDVSYFMYGALFMMAGAYTLSRNGHVRGDFVYRMWPYRVQAGIDLVLFIIFMGRALARCFITASPTPRSPGTSMKSASTARPARRSIRTRR